MPRGFRFAFKEIGLGFDEFKRAVRDLKNDPHVVKVGVLEDSEQGGADRGGITNAQLMAIHEFGAPSAGIPSRPAIRSTFTAKKPELQALIAAGLPKVIQGKLTAEKLLGRAGLFLASEIKKAVMSGEGIPPPNAPSTIAKKGSDRPLVDTNRLIPSITWLVVRRGEGSK